MATVFVSYSHHANDARLKDSVLLSLKALRASGVGLDEWHDRRISAGSDWRAQIKRALDDCDVALLLISTPFLASSFIGEVEVPALFRRRKEEGLPVIPVILSPCSWEKFDWLAAMQVQPLDGKALSAMTMARRNQALVELMAEVHRTIGVKQEHPIGVKQEPPRCVFDRINALLTFPESHFRVHQVLKQAPRMEFQPSPTMLPLEFDYAQARAFRAEQMAANRPDDPHIVVDDVAGYPASQSDVLPVAVVEYYSQLRADAYREARLIVGASSLILGHDGSYLLLQRRASGVASGAKLVHTFGGGYMPYRLSKPGERANRRDDRKSLLRTALRELEEESAIEVDRSHYWPNLVFVLEERWRDKLGHLTFAYVLPLRERVEPKSGWEGRAMDVPIQTDTLFTMIVEGRVSTKAGEPLEVHPQLRGLLYAWIQADTPGLIEAQRRSLDSAALKIRLDTEIDLKLASGA